MDGWITHLVCNFPCLYAQINLHIEHACYLEAPQLISTLIHWVWTGEKVNCRRWRGSVKPLWGFNNVSFLWQLRVNSAVCACWMVYMYVVLSHLPFYTSYNTSAHWSDRIHRKSWAIKCYSNVFAHRDRNWSEQANVSFCKIHDGMCIQQTVLFGPGVRSELVYQR